MFAILNHFLCKAEIGNIEGLMTVAVILDSEIVWFDIAMDVLSHFVHLLDFL